MLKIAIKRHGIVIKTMTVDVARARIGNAAECELQIDDPYLSAHVADLVEKNGVWHIVDSGTALEGVTHGGTRVEDEPVISGDVYNVGGFEMVPELAGSHAAKAPKSREEYMRTLAEQRIPARTVSEDSGSSVPRTMMETDSEPLIPRTMMETSIPDVRPMQRPVAQAVRQSPNSAPGFQPMDSGGRGAAQSGPKKSNALKIIMGVLFAGILLMLIVVMLSGGKKKVVKKEPPAPVKTAVVETPPPPPNATAPDLLGTLHPDEALTLWARQLDEKPDPAIQKRYADIAMELSHVYAANNDVTKSRQYLEGVVKYGPAGSEAVTAAKAKLGRL
jgi:hypothetical protein